ncbi:MAG: type II toxin-antitoxin system HicB family antitoxin [Ignavibacteria bacterium]
MVLDIIIRRTDDGYTAEIPSLKGCESWAHDEDTVMDKILNLAEFYLKTSRNKFKIDKARRTSHKSVYKLVFDKSEIL